MAKSYSVKIVDAKKKAETLKIPNKGVYQTDSLRIVAHEGDKFQLIDSETNLAPKKILVKRVGKDLHVVFENGELANPDLIIENYYSAMDVHLVGQTQPETFAEYVTNPADATTTAQASASMGNPAWLQPAQTALDASIMGTAGIGAAAGAGGALGILAGAGLIAAAASGGGSDGPTNHAPQITNNGGQATAAINAAENQTAVTTVTATDSDGGNLIYSIAGGADANLFDINASTGVVTFKAAPNFEAPGDAGANNVYEIIVQVSDGSLTDTQTITITVTDVNEAPVITSNGGGATAAISVGENQTAVTTVTSTDVDAGSAATYSIAGGADAAKFTIDANTGELTFVAVPNFEAPTDAGADNVYDVIVQVTDGALIDTQDIAVTVTNTNAPAATISAASFVEDSSAQANQNYLVLTGTNYNDFLTVIGAAQGDNIKSEVDWTKLTWTVTDTINASVGFTDDMVAQAVVVSNTELRIYLTDVAWNDLKNEVGLLRSSNSGEDRITADAGFLADASNATANNIAVSPATYEVTLHNSLNDEITETVYSRDIVVHGGGTMEGAHFLSSDIEMTLDGMANGERLDILSTPTNLDSLSFSVENLNGAGTSATIAFTSNNTDSAVQNNGLGDLRVDLVSDQAHTTGLMVGGIEGSHTSIYFTDQAADVVLMAGIQSLDYAGTAVQDGSFEATGFMTDEDQITLANVQDLLLWDGNALDSSDFASIDSGNGDDVNAQTTHIIYDNATGKLYFDADGIGGSDAVILLTLSDQAVLSHTDIVWIDTNIV